MLDNIENTLLKQNHEQQLNHNLDWSLNVTTVQKWMAKFEKSLISFGCWAKNGRCNEMHQQKWEQLPTTMWWPPYLAHSGCCGLLSGYIISSSKHSLKVKVSIIFKHADYPDWFHCKPPNDSSGYENIQREREKKKHGFGHHSASSLFFCWCSKWRYELSKQYRHKK